MTLALLQALSSLFRHEVLSFPEVGRQASALGMMQLTMPN